MDEVFSLAKKRARLYKIFIPKFEIFISFLYLKPIFIKFLRLPFIFLQFVYNYFMKFLYKSDGLYKIFVLHINLFTVCL